MKKWILCHMGNQSQRSVCASVKESKMSLFLYLTLASFCDGAGVSLTLLKPIFHIQKPYLVKNNNFMTTYRN